jgi:glutamate carboxypeptidase
VAESCRIELDLRAASAGAFDLAATEVSRIVEHPTTEGVTTHLRRVAHHPPMERTPAAARLAQLASGIAAELGFALRDAATGGASDANTTSAAGLPTLDGLGPIGGDDHSVDEWLDLASVVPRTTLLAGLIARIRDAL